MIEKTLIAYLSEALTVPVSMEKPVGQQEYVLLDKTGSDEENKIKKATFVVQSHAKSLYEAALLNETVKLIMEGITAKANISKVKLNTDYNYTDAETKEYRYQAVYDLVYME